MLMEAAHTYANEADMMNVVLFGKTAKQWKDKNPTVKGNMRDVATLNMKTCGYMERSSKRTSE